MIRVSSSRLDLAGRPRADDATPFYELPGDPLLFTSLNKTGCVFGRPAPRISRIASGASEELNGEQVCVAQDFPGWQAVTLKGASARIDAFSVLVKFENSSVNFAE